MANEKVLQNFNDLYNKLYAQYRPSYTPQSASTLKDTLSRAMRPSYDKQIAQRRRDAASNRAAIDADASSRGVGSSTYVTDVKNRNMNAEASDVAGIESDYNAALYSALLNRLNAQDELTLSAENSARDRALGLTQSLYGKVYGSSGGGGGYGRRGSPGSPDDETPEDLGDFGNTGNTGTPSTSTKPRTRENGDQTTPYRRRGVSSGGSGQPRSVNVGLYQ